jgi:hypothetical protein
MMPNCLVRYRPYLVELFRFDSVCIDLNFISTAGNIIYCEEADWIFEFFETKLWSRGFTGVFRKSIFVTFHLLLRHLVILSVIFQHVQGNDRLELVDGSFSRPRTAAMLETDAPARFATVQVTPIRLLPLNKCQPDSVSRCRTCGTSSARRNSRRRRISLARCLQAPGADSCDTTIDDSRNESSASMH